MRTATRTAAALLTAALAFCTATTQAQNVHHGESFVLSDTLSPGESHEYTANSYIDLLPGFHSTPNPNKSTLLNIDPYGVYPPEEGLTGGPNASDTGVVGTIDGTVNVGLMGAAVYSIPIEVPVGINGMQPNLSITYNSQAGNGLLGWGWDISGLSLIERTGKTRYHDGVSGCVTLDDELDRFMLDGVRLIKVANSTDSMEFKAEQDDMSRIKAYFRYEQIGGGPVGNNTIMILDHFKVWKPNGLVLEYGATEDSWIDAQNVTNHALCWLLNKVTDRNGNSMLFHYNENTTEGEYEIASIEYTEHTENGIVVVSPEFIVDFHYRSAYRQDYDFSYVAGNIVQHRKLLDHISIKRNTNQTVVETERYSFKYRIDSIMSEYGTVKMHNRLEEIQLEKDGAALNPTRITWTSNKDSHVLTNVRIYDTAIYNNFPFVGDFNGDGLSDLAVVPHMDSVYTHNVDISFFTNNPDSPGHFTRNTSMTIQNVDKRLDWLYPVDLNDDGLDDLVACFYDSLATGNESMDVVIFENTGGTHFESMDTISISSGRYLVRTGDFLGNGKVQLLVVPVYSLLSLSFPKLVYHDGNVYRKASSATPLLQVRDVATGDFDGDGHTEMFVVKNNNATLYSLETSSSVLSFNELLNTSEISHSEGKNHVFTGDFNGDGKTDVLFNDKIHNNNHDFERWRIFHSTGLSFSATSSLGIHCELQNHNLYSYSLRKVFDVMNQPNNWPGTLWGICAADFDGDGASDIAITKMTCTSSNIYIYCHYLPLAHGFQSFFMGSSYNAAHQNDPGYYYINCKSQYFHVGNFLGKENLSFLGLEFRDSNWHGVSARPGVFSFKPASELNSVGTVMDGMGNITRFGYDYVRQPYEDYGYGVRCIPTPIRVLTSITTYNASDRRMEDKWSYQDPCHHRDGHGWLGFRKTMMTSYEDEVETERTVSTHSLEVMTRLAMLLPKADTTFVFHDGIAALLSTTSYQFHNAVSVYGALNMSHLVACPALTGKNTVRYDPDHPGTVLSRTFVRYHYNYSTGKYTHAYHCDSIVTGVGGASATVLDDCEFKSKESTEYFYDNYVFWTINRPHIQTQVFSRTGKPDVVTERWYEYATSDTYLPSRVFDIPGGELSQNPFMLQTDFVYCPDGNLMRKTVIAPHGQYGEQPRIVEYTYDRSHRLAVLETVRSGSLSYGTSYAYDDFDRVDTVTGANGLATAFENDAFGTTSWTSRAEGTLSCTALRWSAGHPLAPPGALYYSWRRSSDGSRELTFFHKTGAELRSVGYGLHGEPLVTDRRYDERGRLAAVSDTYKEGETPRWTSYGYDGLNRIDTVIMPDTTFTTTSYHGFVTQTTVTPPTGNPQTSSVTVNAMGWTVRSDDPDGSFVTYDHYADGLMASATVNGDSATMVTASYDAGRHRASLSDPDYGTLVTAYDAYGRLRSSASPRESAAQVQTTCVYDGLDRVASVTDGLEGSVTQYTYNEMGVEKGTVMEIRFRTQGGADIQRITYTYDTLARPVRATEQRGSNTHVTLVEYDSQSRVCRLVHPSGYAVRYGYQQGYWTSVTDNDGKLLWRTNDLDARGQLLEVEMGNGAITRHAYDSVTHRLKSIVTMKNLQNLSYEYDNFGNLAARKDWKVNMEETFTYDNMNRLTGITLTRPSGSDLHCDVTYDALGRMTSRQAVTAENAVPQVTSVFSQPAFDPTKVHAFASATTTEGMFPATPQTVTYTGFDKVGKVKQGSDSLCYTYGYDRQRIFMEEHLGPNVRTKQYWGACEYVTESDGTTSASSCRTFITGPFGVFAVMMTKGANTEVFYILKDNLGSWTTITNSSGTVEQQLSYDAWGNLRNPNTWANYTAGGAFEKPMFDRGYTGHEHLTDFGLVNMNGRVYDPVMSSFLSADRFVQNPLSAMGFNRYSYCLNNPLRYVDPSGWLAGGGGNGDHPPGVPYLLNGVITIDLPEVDIVSNAYNEFEYTPYYYGGGGANVPWNNGGNGQQIGPGTGGSGGGSGAHGEGHRSLQPNDTEPINTRAELQLVYSTMFLYEGQVWPNSSKVISIEAGQHVQVVMVNESLMGVQLSIQDITTYHYSTNFWGIQQIVYTGDGCSFVMLPKQSRSFDFYKFDYSPMNWSFEFETTLSVAVNVRIVFYSEWKPGMQIDPNHPKLKKP